MITPIQVYTEQEFKIFYNKYRTRFVRYAFYYINDMEASEDIVHDAILYYWENRDKVSSETDVLGYILLTVKNKCLNYLKHLRVEDEYKKQCVKLHAWEVEARIKTLDHPCYDNIFTKETLSIIEGLFAKLPQQTRNIFIQNRIEDKSRKEIAHSMGVSLQKIDYHINKANRLIFSILKEYLPSFFISF